MHFVFILASAFSHFSAALCSLVGVARMRDFRYCAHPPFGVPSARFHGDSGFSHGSLFYQESGERVGSAIPTPTWDAIPGSGSAERFRAARHAS